MSIKTLKDTAKIKVNENENVRQTTPFIIWHIGAFVQVKFWHNQSVKSINMELYFIFHIMHFKCASSLICTIILLLSAYVYRSAWVRLGGKPSGRVTRAYCASRRNLPGESNTNLPKPPIFSNKTDKYLRNIQLRIFCSTPEIIVVAHTVNVVSTEEFQPIQRNNLRTSCNPNHAE